MAGNYTHGIRIPPFESYGTFMGKYPYDVIPGGPNDAWVPGSSNTGRFAEIPIDRFLYERLDWSQFLADLKALNLGYGPYQLSNPPFLGAGQIMGSAEGPSWMYLEDPNTVRAPGSKPGLNRILRGYIRRRDINNPGDPTQYARLYFMYNPEQIQRTYVSGLDVQGWDGVDRSEAEGQMAPLTFASVDFSLFFDRQVEVAKDAKHPGVLVDLQVFDVLGRGKIPGMKYLRRTADGLVGVEDNVSGAGTFVLGVNDTNYNDLDLAVVFSPNLVFEGKIKGATAVFEKFSSRMIPTRMTLTVNLMLTAVVTTASSALTGNVGGSATGTGAGTGTSSFSDPNSVAYNKRQRDAAVQYALAVANARVVTYNSDRRLRWREPSPTADCSSFIYFIYTDDPPLGVSATPVKWSKELFANQVAPNTFALTQFIYSEHTNRFRWWPRWALLGGAPWKNWSGGVKTLAADESAFERAWAALQPGDIVCRSPSGEHGHVIMIAAAPMTVGGTVEIVHCASGQGTGNGVRTSRLTKEDLRTKYEYAARPQLKTEVAAADITATQPQQSTEDFWETR